MTERPRGRELSSLLRARLARASGMLSVPLASVVTVMLVLGLLLVRMVDGPSAFVSGVVARAVTVHLVLVAQPFAYAVARLGATWPAEPGLVALARLRGWDDGDVARRVPLAALRVAVGRILAPCLVVAVLAALASLPDVGLAAQRLAVGLALVGIGIASAAGLASLAALLARVTRRWARLLLVVVLVGPWMLARIPGVPREASPFGAYTSARDALLRSAP